MSDLIRNVRGMSDPTFRQVRLGEALKRLRERSGLSQREAAYRLRYNYQKLSRIENGQLPDYHGLRAMLDLYGVLVTEEPPFIDYGGGHFAACWRARESIELLPGVGATVIAPPEHDIPLSPTVSNGS